MKRKKGKSKTALIQALLSKDKEKINEALGVPKPFKVLFMVQEEDGKIYLEEGFNRKEISLNEKEELLNQKDENVILFMEEKCSELDQMIND